MSDSSLLFEEHLRGDHREKHREASLEHNLVEPQRPLRADQLRQGFRWLVGELYSDHETNRRKAAFRKLVRARREALHG